MNDELTPSERAALRARIVGGAHDIKPVGAHRNAWIAGSVAAAMVVAIAGGAAVTSTLSAPEIATTPSPSATVTAAPVPVPTPTATPTPTQEPVVLPRGSAPFDGACDNAIDGADLDAAAGMKMGRVGPDWIDSAATVRGGIECLWYSSEEYSAAFVEVGVFPDGQQPTNPALVQDPGCRDNYGRLLCIRQGAAEGMTAWVRVSSVHGDVVSAGADRVLDAVLSRVSRYPVGVAATALPTWWSAPDCARLAEVIDAESLSLPDVTVEKVDATSGRDGACRIDAPSEDIYASWSATMSVIGGGAVNVPSIIAAGGQRTDVAGAAEAYWVSWHDGIDGGGSEVLAVSDGENLLLVDVPFNLLPAGGDLPRATTIAQKVLPLL